MRKGNNDGPNDRENAEMALLQAADERRKSEEEESEGRKKSKKAGAGAVSEAKKSEMSQWFSLFADLDPGR